MPAISVLIPARNCEAYIAEAINSVLHQTFTDWEMLVADDGSTDRTREIIDQYDDLRIRRFHNASQLGVVHTRNKLLQHTKGELITWLDADDVSHSRRLERLVEAFDEQASLFLCGSNITRRYKLTGDYLVTNYPLTHENIRSVIEQQGRIPFTGASVAFRREVLSDIPGFRPFFNIGGGDPDFILRVSEKYRVGNVPDALYEVRYTRNSTSRQFSESSFLKLYLQRILFFLAGQRIRDAGLDGLMDGGNRQEFQAFLDSLRREFEEDRSIIYRRACQNKISNQDYAFALLDALRAVHSNPVASANYRLFGRLGGSFVKTVFRMMAQRKRNGPTNHSYS